MDYGLQWNTQAPTTPHSHRGGDPPTPRNPPPVQARPCSPPSRPGRPISPDERTSPVATATETVTGEDLLTRYADDIGYVAEAESPADALDVLAHHLETAATNFDMAGINGHEDVQTVAGYINEAAVSDDDTERAVFLRKADKLLKRVWEMTQEYREMVGD